MMRIPRAFEGWEVLVVDDERDNLDVAARMLKISGAAVVTASSGKQALDIVRAQPARFRFILSDLSMPEMDGWELLYELKLQPDTAEIPVIALTAHAMAGDRERGMAAGFHHYITKPLDPTKFIQQLVTLLVEIPKYAVLLNAGS